jgi:hypothetical protein
MLSSVGGAIDNGRQKDGRNCCNREDPDEGGDVEKVHRE